MKKFIIISTILILLAAGAFGYSLYHYMSVTGMLNSRAAQTTSVTVKQNPSENTNATETPAAGMSDTAGEGLFAASMQKAEKYVETLSKEQMVGQVILGVCDDS